MKIRVFQSDKGDCLLLTGKDGRHILADGGMPASYTKHVAPTMKRIQEKGEAIDLVYVSHIDEDHIAGILRMLDDAMDWAIYDYQIANGNPSHRKPRSVRPPEIKSIWHNSFHEQVGKNSGEIQDMLAAQAPALSLRGEEWAQHAAEEFLNIATSPRQAALVSRRIGAKQLNIPLNPEYGGGLMFVPEPPDFIDIGSMRITVVGPFQEDLKELRDEWNKWLDSSKGRTQIAKIRSQSRRDERSIGNAELDSLLGSFLALADELGDRNKVTAPNLASLMLLIEEDGKTVLMTGDGHPDDLMDGLEVAGKLRSDGTMHVNVLKMLHHGSEFNWHKEFGKRITADEYVFCGDGSHENPDPRVVKGVINSRLGSRSNKSGNPEVDQPFRLSFNSSEAVTKTRNQHHMKELERIVKRAADRSEGKMKSFFLASGGHYDITV